MKQPKKILIIRFSSIGDIVLTSPVVRVLKSNFPDTEIHFITKHNFQDQLVHHPQITKIWSFKYSIKELIKDLKLVKFDLVIDLHKNLRSHLLSFQLAAPTIRFQKLTVKKFLYTKFKINLLPNVHLVDRYLNSLEKLGLKIDDIGLEYFIDQLEIDEAGKLLSNINERFVAVALGAAHFTKSPPQKLWENILEKSPIAIVLLGGQKEERLSLELVDFLRERGKNVINLVGKIKINVSAAVVSKATFVICPDTGVMHIAAAFHKPIVSIWGSTTAAFGMSPYYGNKSMPLLIAEVPELSCRPCSKIGYEACPKKHFDCMNKIKHQEITQWYLDLLSASD